MSGWWKVAILIAIVGVISIRFGGWDKDGAIELLKEWSDKLGIWGIPLYISIHTFSIAFCLPSAVFLEAAAPLLFGFFNAVLIVFSAKILGASLSFWIGRLVFRSSRSAVEWAHRNKYFDIISKGVEKDGWRFVLLARFSPLPSYVINYTLAATQLRFLFDFLLPTAVGCVPMILQNTSIGTLAAAAVAAPSASGKSQFSSYFFPLLGILSSVLISLRIKSYSNQISLSQTSPDKKD